MSRLPTVAALFDSGLRVFSKEWKHLSSAVVLLSLPLYVLSLGLETKLYLFTPYLILSLIIGPLISIITTVITYYRYDLDKTIHSEGLYKFIHDRFFPVLWTSILLSIIIILSMVLLILPLAVLGIVYLIAQPTLLIGGALSSFGLLALIVLIICAIFIGIGVGVYVMFTLPIVVLDRCSGLVAINKSIALVKGRWWNIFGRVLILQIIALFIASIIGIFSGLLVGYENLGYLITTLLQQVAVLPISLAMVIFYLDMRKIKKSVKLKLSDDKFLVEESDKATKSSSKKTLKKSSTTAKTSSKKATKKSYEKSTKKSSKKSSKNSNKKSTKKKTTKR